MSFPILCPNCGNNKTCSAPVTLKVVSRNSQAFQNAATLSLTPSVPFSKHQVCSGICGLIQQALATGVETVVVEVPSGLLEADLKLTGAVVNCRAIQLLAHHECGSLKEIAIVADEKDVPALEAGIKSAHPLCINCYEAV